MKRRRCISAIRSYETVAYWHLPNKGQNQWDKQDQRGCESVCACVVMCGVQRNFCGAGMYVCNVASVAQCGERQTEDLKVPGSIPGRGTFAQLCRFLPSSVLFILMVMLYQQHGALQRTGSIRLKSGKCAHSVLERPTALRSDLCQANIQCSLLAATQAVM